MGKLRSLAFWVARGAFLCEDEGLPTHPGGWGEILL